ncbi:MAG: hypothetical protein IR526_02660 [Bordetella sp.]|nr:MAG: hypothetical protein IR526_02660 [Bordetella sp.]
MLNAFNCNFQYRLSHKDPCIKINGAPVPFLYNGKYDYQHVILLKKTLLILGEDLEIFISYWL